MRDDSLERKCRTAVSAGPALSGKESSKSTSARQADLADLTEQSAAVKTDTSKVVGEALAVVPAS